MIARVALIVLVLASCDNPPTPVECHDIPAGGCLAYDGVDVCAQDMTCTAVYGCVNGGWVLDQKCPPRAHDASTDTGASDATTPLSDVHIDAPPGSFGGPGCTDLETPDCSVGTALLCAGATDCCGCTDLWVCQNGGWVAWGTCGDAGVVQN